MGRHSVPVMCRDETRTVFGDLVPVDQYLDNCNIGRHHRPGSCEYQGFGFCTASVDGFCVGGTPNGDCHG